MRITVASYMQEPDRLAIFCAILQGTYASPNVGRVKFDVIAEQTQRALYEYRAGLTVVRTSFGVDDKGLPDVGIAGQIRLALEQMISEPDDLIYPERDVYGQQAADDVAAPFWTECGLYGRVGKEAARTLLARRRHALRVLGRDPNEE